jgi:hypothetical protein
MTDQTVALTPVDHDPWADPALSGVTLTPVPHDPFLEPGAGLDPGTGSPALASAASSVFGGPSWWERAQEQSRRDQEAYARGGVRETPSLI